MNRNLPSYVSRNLDGYWCVFDSAGVIIEKHGEFMTLKEAEAVLDRLKIFENNC